MSALSVVFLLRKIHNARIFCHFVQPTCKRVKVEMLPCTHAQSFP